MMPVEDTVFTDDDDETVNDPWGEPDECDSGDDE